LVLEEPYGPKSANAVKMLRERILTAQSYLTGVAPVGQAAANAVDDAPDFVKEDEIAWDDEEKPSA
jgi:hypothetical protein